MNTFSRRKLAITILSALSFAFGVVEIALEMYVKDNFRARASKTMSIWPPQVLKDPSLNYLALIPANLITSVTAIIVSAGAFAIVIGVVGVLYILVPIADEVEVRRIPDSSL